MEKKNAFVAALLAVITFVGYPALMFVVAAGVSGCSTEEYVTPTPGTIEIRGAEICTNGMDDDGNGLVDCAGSHCMSMQWCTGAWYGAQYIPGRGVLYTDEVILERPSQSEHSFIDGLFQSWWTRITILIGFVVSFGYILLLRSHLKQEKKDLRVWSNAYWKEHDKNLPYYNTGKTPHQEIEELNRRVHFLRETVKALIAEGRDDREAAELSVQKLQEQLDKAKRQLAAMMM